MKRVQVQLTDEQIAALRREADSSGTAVAAVVRTALDEWMARRDLEARWDRAMAVGGKFHSGLGDLAENHDYYLGEGDW